MYERFGKSFKDIAPLKVSFFEQNEKFMQRALHYADIYVDQPRRTACKICDAPLPEDPSFVKHTIPYVVCTSCTHLNGMHEDTDAFCEAVYTSGGGKEYAENYTPADREHYEARRKAIYIPKAEFMFETLRQCGEDPLALTYADMGAGSGYFVSALRELGVEGVTGYEVGAAQVNLATWMMPDEPVQQIGLDDTVGLTATAEADVVTFIGVFEHVQSPRAILRALKQNPRARYFYFCVPMFGPCIYNEMAFPHVMPRQLAVGHTHLFTKGSIESFRDEFDLETVGAWWFGTDVMDYYRSVHVALGLNPEMRPMVESWSALYEPLIDDLQLAIDRRRESGQVHMVMRIRD
jgi:hypothetical protein